MEHRSFNHGECSHRTSQTFPLPSTSSPSNFDPSERHCLRPPVHSHYLFNPLPVVTIPLHPYLQSRFFPFGIPSPPIVYPLHSRAPQGEAKGPDQAWDSRRDFRHGVANRRKFVSTPSKHYANGYSAAEKPGGACTCKKSR